MKGASECTGETLLFFFNIIIFLIFSGNFMWLGLHYYYGYGALTSPPVMKEYNYCYLAFYYMLRETGYASLTSFIEDHNGNDLTILWKTDQTMRNWKKKVLKLPTTPSNYSVVFLGYSHYYGRLVAIDDIQFKRCDSCKYLFSRT